MRGCFNRCDNNNYCRCDIGFEAQCINQQPVIVTTGCFGLKVSGKCLYHFLHTPQLPPFFAQCAQPEQFLQALQYFEPVHFAWLLVVKV